MEDHNLSNNLSSLPSENFQEYNSSNKLLLNETRTETLSSQITSCKNEAIKKEKDEIKEIMNINKNNEINEIQKQKEENLIKNIQNSTSNEIKENKNPSLITNLINIQKLIRKEMSTRETCKKINIK